MAKPTEWSREKRGKRLVALALGPALWMLAVDSAVSHFAGKDMENRLQLIPVAYGLAGGVGLIFFALLPLSLNVFRWAMRGLGAFAVAVGLAGTFWHLVPLLEDLKDEKLSLASVEGAISLAPPVLAPLAFSGVGLIMCVLGSRRVLIRVLPRRASGGGSQTIPLRAVPEAPPVISRSKANETG